MCNWNRRVVRLVGHRQLEPVFADPRDFRSIPGQKLPMLVIGLVEIRVAPQFGHRIALRVDRDTYQTYSIVVGPVLGMLLKGFKPGRLFGAGRSTIRENEVRDPNIPRQILGAERGPVLFRQLKLRHGKQNSRRMGIDGDVF